jgi:hypothetical protein
MYDLPRIPLPTSASSAELARLPAVLRQQALFSARLNLADPVAEIGSSIKGILDGKKSMSQSRQDIRAALDAAGYRVAGTSPEKPGALTDHTSRSRLDLILTQNVRFARGYGARAASMNPDRLNLWPAQDLVRVMSRKVPRTTWKQRWQEAGGELAQGRMVALKTSPIWENLSVFGLPYPPFDFGSGMGLMEIDRDEAISLGLLRDDDTLTPEEIPFPATTEANLPDVAGVPALQAAIAKVFGSGATFQDGVLSLLEATAMVGAQGSAKSLGMGKLSATTVQPPPALVRPQEASSLLSTGQAVAKDPNGTVARFTPQILDHWKVKSYTPAMIDARLSRIRQAFTTVQAPQETWQRPNGDRWYLREFTGSKRMLVQTDKDGKVITFIPTSQNPGYFERKREGTLSIREGAS